MTDTPHRTEPVPWRSGPIIRWLLDEGRLTDNVDETVEQLGQRMLSAGAPLWRLRLSMRTLHPLIAAFSSVWEREAGDTERIETPHGLEGRSGYIGSPLEIIGRTGQAFRKRLSATLTSADHTVLHELKARGATDYFGLPLLYSSGTTASLVFTTDAAGGFSDHDIACFTEIASVVAPIAEVFSTRRIALAVAEAYLGPRTGRRVLEGQITRGDVETINAAILVSDIRDWSGLSNRLPAEEALALANRYFEIVARAVEGHGGEILKLIGDGVLAIFPADEGSMSAEAACRSALSAARQALQTADTHSKASSLRFGTGLHFGEVLYGNIGSTTRIDFTVLGQAVNIASRIEGLCSPLGEPILFSEAFAERLAEPSAVVADEVLKGHEGTFRVFTVSPSA
ncbi:adenylate/guanylate cyclase domain-containing protein [Pelagibius sp.]|uniref:adenylate/guanylate cyclase domain-containing protein n=1 Tax=Pelagibius sp. TaxID=1931238 RepID=UPI002605FB90|nr:adenylate/guanylate cyclase domain-containing protein [Pelagibius sp.]